MFRWLVLSAVILTIQCKITPGIYYYPPKQQSTEDVAVTGIIQRTFFAGAELRGRLMCDNDAVTANSTYQISVFSLKTLCLKKDIDVDTQTQIDDFVHFLLKPDADSKAKLWKDSWIRCFQLDVTCTTSVPTLNFAKDKTFCPGYKVIKNMKQEADIAEKKAAEKTLEDAKVAAENTPEDVNKAAENTPEDVKGSTKRLVVKREEGKEEDKGKEGDEEDKGKEGDEEDKAKEGDEEDKAKEGDEGDKAKEGDEGDKGKEGDEGEDTSPKALSWGEGMKDSMKNKVNSLIIGKDPLSGTFYNMINVTTTGTFFIGWNIQPSEENAKVSSVTLIIKAHGLHGYLAAQDYPLLIFYAVLSVLYALLALFWLIVCAVHWRDILQIQCWIGAILALNMVEMSVYFSKYETVNNGQPVSDGVVVCAEIISAFKHALSRVLVLIICMGYGIVKPRLGTTKHLVFAVGLAYFLFVAIDGIYTKIVGGYTDKQQRLYAFVPNAVINAIIIWWIIASLVSTTRTLRIRRNVIKLTLYRHFTNCLVFAILSFLGFFVWWFHLMQDGCIKNWREYWLTDDIFWHLLFTLILIAIMFLWRPTLNNSRYAFSPLLDTDEDEDEATINEAFEGMKLRNIKKNGTVRNAAAGNFMEDDLKWVEENIPSSMADTVLEQFIDSEEENEQKLYEMSKMQ